MTHRRSEIADVDFAEWLKGEISKRHWTQNTVGQKANISKSEVSRIMNGKRPSISVCEAMALAMGVPFDVVLIRAGIIARPPDYDEQDQNLLAKFKRLNRLNRVEIEKIMDLKLEMQKNRPL